MKSTLSHYSWLRFLRNKYAWVLVFFCAWMIFLDNYSWLDHQALDKEIQELEDNRDYYKEEISNDSRNIKVLKNTEQIEKYAREKYYMKRDSEDIYIIELEDDHFKKDD